MCYLNSRARLKMTRNTQRARRDGGFEFFYFGHDTFKEVILR